VVRGYGILQPRVTASLTTGDESSFFQRVFSANRGLDPYVFAVSDLYQDVFGKGTFTGKGLYHVDAMEARCAAASPRIRCSATICSKARSHRAALVTDIEVVEDYPGAISGRRVAPAPLGARRLAAAAVHARSGLGRDGISRWKMVDNLRRTLTPIFWVASAATAWASMPFTFAAQWMTLLVLALFIAPTFDLIHALTPKSTETTLRGHIAAFAREFVYASAQVALKVVLIAHNAWMMGDAIVRTLYRLFFSRKNLLEWRTASQVQKSQPDTLSYYYGLMAGSVVIAAGCLRGCGRWSDNRRKPGAVLYDPVGSGAGNCLVYQPFGGSRGRVGCHRRRQGEAAPDRAENLALLRDPCH
jgi:cyclic beta-1,2-glucan synthetase